MSRPRTTTPATSNTAAEMRNAAAALKQPTVNQTIEAQQLLNDPVSLMLLLSKHKESLQLTLKEVSALKSVIRGLENTVQELQRERKMMLEQLQNAKQNETELIRQIQNLTETCEQLTLTIQKRGVESANRITALESNKREHEIATKTVIERLHTQLVSTQHPVSSARPMPWNQVMQVDGHPAHVLREVVLQDARREEKFMSKSMTVNTEDDPLEKLLQHSKPPPERASHGAGGLSGQGYSEDEAVWRQVLLRIYNILKDRRKIVYTTSEQGPVDFMLRSRHVMVGEIVHLHHELRKVSTMVNVIGDMWDSPGSGSVEGQIELISSILGDLDASLHRVKIQAFTDVDRVYHSLSQPVVEEAANIFHGKSIVAVPDDPPNIVDSEEMFKRGSQRRPRYRSIR